MYRRRRPQRELIAFSFDSFLDVVANVIGIIVRLILVAWVGARSYSATMQWVEEGPPPAYPAPQAADDPLHAELEQARREIEAARADLAARLAELQRSEEAGQAIRQQLVRLTGHRQELDARAARLSGGLKAGAAPPAVELAELRERARKLRDEIAALETQPSAKQLLQYHAPLSRAVHADEIFFECKDGRVTYIDLPAFLQEVRSGLEDKGGELKTQ